MADLDQRFKDLDLLNTSVSWTEVRNRRPGPPPPEPRGPSRFAAIALALAVGAGGVSLAVRAFLSAPSHPPTSSTSSPPTSPAAPTMRVGASGLVVARSSSNVRFCVPLMLASLTSGPPKCGSFVKTTGVDLSRLSNRRTVDGVTFGDAYLAGSLQDGTLHVSQQTPPRPATSEPSLRQPPCQAPKGGWARSDAPPSLDPVDGYERTHPHEVSSLALFHPAARTWVVTIASTNPARTSAILESTYPDQLCVLQSHYRVSDVTAARATVTSFAQHHQYGVYGVGLGAAQDGQPRVIVSAVVDTPALEAAISSLPAGLVRIEPWLEPLAP
jgi:hypothetical protein